MVSDGDANGSSSFPRARSERGEPPSSAEKSPEMAQPREGSAKALFVCFVGIFICYFYYGILQEKM